MPVDAVLSGFGGAAAGVPVAYAGTVLRFVDGDGVYRLTLTRDLVVGGGGKQMVALGYYAPGLMDTLMEKVFGPLSTTDAPPRPRSANGLDGPSGTLDAYGDYDGHVMQSSLYTQAVMHPWRALGVAAAAGLALALATRD